MIHYKSSSGAPWNHFLNLFQMKGSGFPQAFLFALFPAGLTFYLKSMNTYSDGDILSDNTAWGGFSFLVGFLMVFRTTQAYSRFWDGCSATHKLRAEWIDACSNIIAFCKHSKESKEKVSEFKHLIVRLFSLLHMFALAHIEECEDMEDIDAFDLELIDPNGLDAESWRSIRHCKNRVTLVFQWIQCAIVENINTGVMAIPPPILSRVFQELANGMVCLHDAHKISSIPFPFPYAQTCDALLILHSCITPFITSEKVQDPYWATCLAFIQVFILWSLNYIAVEIEHPFGNDANDLNAAEMQLDVNMNLLLLLHPSCDRTPTLTENANIKDLVRNGRRASQRIDRAKTRTFNEILQQAAEDSRNPPPSDAANAMWNSHCSSHVDDSSELNDKGSRQGSREVAMTPPPIPPPRLSQASQLSSGSSRRQSGDGSRPAPRQSMIMRMGLQSVHEGSLARSKLADPDYNASFWDMSEPTELGPVHETRMDSTGRSEGLQPRLSPLEPALQPARSPGLQVLADAGGSQAPSSRELSGGSQDWPPDEYERRVSHGVTRAKNGGDNDPDPQAPNDLATNTACSSTAKPLSGVGAHLGNGATLHTSNPLPRQAAEDASRGDSKNSLHVI